MRTIHRRRRLVLVLGVLATMAALLTTVPALAHETGCDTELVSHEGNTWKVYPNGTDDTATLECVLHEAAMYHGDERPQVWLAEGTFHVDWLFAAGFDGRLRGMSTESTVIQPLDGGLDCVSQFEATGFTVWMAFMQSDLRVSDLTVEIPDVACQEPYIEDVSFDPELGEDVGFIGQDFNIIVAVGTRSPESTDVCAISDDGGLKVRRVHVNAPTPNFGEPIFHPKGAFSAFRVGGVAPANCEVFDDLVGKARVVDSHAQGVGNLLLVEAMADSRIAFKRNTTFEVDQPVIIANAEGSTARIVDNELDSVFGLGVIGDNCTFGPAGPDCLEDTSYLRVKRNEISLHPFAFIGVGVFDAELVPAPHFDAKIVENDIVLSENFAGVGLLFNDGTRVARNSVSGAAVFGAILEGVTVNSRVAYNDMTALTAFEAGILLGEMTSNNVVKGNQGATVVDLGSGNQVSDSAALAGLRNAGQRSGLRMASVGWSALR